MQNSKKRPLAIGFTERGDGGLDLSWRDAVEHGRVDGAVIVTKSLNAKAREQILNLTAAGYKLIVHAGCTGWGSSWLEPHVPTPTRQIDNIAALIADGFDPSLVTLRVDPIIPTEDGLARAADVFDLAASNLPLDDMRIRVSVLDEYPHVRARLEAVGKQPFLGGYFQAGELKNAAIVAMLEAHVTRRADGSPREVETCAEHLLVTVSEQLRRLTGNDSNVRLIERGCLSLEDLRRLGIDESRAPASTNGQRRGGCLCLTAKREILPAQNRKPCPHGCLYCYWKDKS